MVNSLADVLRQTVVAGNVVLLRADESSDRGAIAITADDLGSDVDDRRFHSHVALEWS